MVSLINRAFGGQAGISSRSAINSTFSCRLTLTCSGRSCFTARSTSCWVVIRAAIPPPSLRVWESIQATVAYGLNRADWSYIPGGVISGTAMIRPDFPNC